MSTRNSASSERERIRQERMSVLTTQLALLIKRKKDLRKELLDKRDEQVKTGQETDEVRQGRRDELQNLYREYAEKVVSPVLEYARSQSTMPLSTTHLG